MTPSQQLYAIIREVSSLLNELHHRRFFCSLPPSAVTACHYSLGSALAQ